MARRTDRLGRTIQYLHDDLGRRTTEEWYSVATTASLSIATQRDGGTEDEVQRVGFNDSFGTLSGGTFTLSFGGQTTSGIAYDASAATVESALEGLSSIGAGNISVTKLQDTASNQEWQVTFTGTLGATDVNQMTIDASSVMTMMGFPPTESEVTDVAGRAAGNDEQTVTLTNTSGGTFRLAFEDETSTAIADDASAATVESALEALDTVDDVTVTGSAGGPWTVAFVGAHAGLDVSLMGGDDSTLTGGTLAKTITSEYDAANQLTSVSDSASSYAYTYDDLGRVLSVDNYGTTGVPNVILTAVYDAAGNRTSLAAEIATVDDFLNSYTYDALHRLTRLDQAGQAGGNSVAEKRLDFAYNAIDQFSSIARYADTAGASTDEVATSTYTYDSLNRLTGLPHAEGGVNLFTAYSWSYDSMSRITQFVSADGTSDYTYDTASQLTGADHTYQTDESYSYDDNGNRTNTGYSTGSDNRLLSDGVYDYLYDDEGNRTKKTEIATGEATEYEWDHRNRLVQVTHLDSLGSPTQTLDYTYDVFDARIGTSDTPVVGPAYTERYVYDGKHLALKFDGSALANRYLHGPVIDQILADEQVSSLTSPGDVLWPLTDNLGTVRDLASHDSGTGVTTVANHISYDAFGGITAETNAAVDHLFGYTGREWDAEADLQYNRARWYDPAVGRWLSQDPIGFSGGDPNLYRYVGNSSTIFTDPRGLEEEVRGDKVLIKTPEDALALARISQEAYNGTELGDAGLKHTTRVQDDLIIIAFAGTDLAPPEELIKDMDTNIAQLHGTPEQYDEARKLVENTITAHPGIPVILTGHSLGAALATYAAIANERDAVVFNPPGVSTERFSELGIGKVEREKREEDVHVYQVKGELLTWAQDRPVPFLFPRLPDTVGEIHKIGDDMSPFLDVLDPLMLPERYDRHRIETVIEIFEELSNAD